MQTVSLIPHPKAPPRGVDAVTVELGFAGDRLHLRYAVDHDGALKIPSRQGRLDELWKTTCFEIFVRDGAGPGYIEFNLAPDDAWAGYGFSGERQGMHNIDVVTPLIAADAQPARFELSVSVERAALPADLGPASLSAVIEELDGTLSYWAVAHPQPQAFDFHDPRCFVLDVAQSADDRQISLPK